MYIFNDDTQNYPFCILQLVVETFGLNEQTYQNLKKFPKLLSQPIRECFDFGD